jgi:peptidoglycan/LPS O-acetylase OafA/YrhL
MHRPYLDTCRGLAILLVIAVHAGIANQGPAISAFGQRGVQMFFIVSAFTLCMSMQSRAGERKSWIAFYIRRFSRIAPMYYLALIANCALEGGRNLGDSSATALFTTLTFTHGMIPEYVNTTVIGGWSVAVEFCFYALFPLVFKYLTNWRIALISVLASVIACTCVDVVLSNIYPERREYFQFVWVVAELPVFLMGFLAFHLQPLTEKLSFRRRIPMVAALAASTCMLVYVSLPTRNGSLYIASFAFVPALLALSLAPARWIVNRVSVFVGTISYSAYLIHFFVLAGVKVAVSAIWTTAPPTGPMGFALYFISTVAITSMLSWISWRWIEQPGVAMGRLWIKRLQADKTPAVPVARFPA